MFHVKYATALRPMADFAYPFFSFQLHANCRTLHNYTLHEKKKAARGEGPGFDGELNNFQAPQLSSLAKLVSIFLFAHCCLSEVSDDLTRNAVEHE
jgi:hypothetical protein